MKLTLLAAIGAATLSASSAQAQSRPDQVAFRALYKELVETNTTLSVGSCTAAAEKMGARLKAAGYADKDVTILVPTERPKDGALVATLAGTDAKAKPIMLLAHIDVVEANRADWERDPFTLIEEGGYFYARGASDDKAMASVFTDSMIRYKTEGFKPRRGLKLVLTCGEETSDTFDGVEWMLKTHRPMMDAQFALNEGGAGRLDAKGNRQFLGIQAGEKVYQDFTLVTTNPGGHSSRPSKDNAIYHLSAALSRLGAYDFPIHLNEATKNHFEKMSVIEGGASGAAMAAVAKDPTDAAAVAEVVKDASRNSMMRTTCVATMVNAGHAPNALPQRAEANVNCRILPGESLDSVKAQLIKVFADDKIAVTLVGTPSPVSPPPPLTKAIVGPIEQVSKAMWPGVPFVPAMSTGATDSRFTNAAGIPSYGLSGMFGDPDGGGVHGLNERIRVRSLYEGRDFLYSVVKLYAMQK
ncbi:M20/M25/M40 family metallo-hydrolase [Phenylobacterium sp. 20VBR1]|uniref:M20/M25/M40 family metallo-hydrolase n=1 Tax=Phenylobacterium glaciei TaxID=2803784 RepID=A0A941CZU1_9CAUL|nr:M20/M25/M40 family metallo-hydrolase [Phenylobacterium glaciei]MBR7618869.1 M20/M25/M40 family metallo-hydrolase [Phenylobacterium glaciei]